MSDKKLDLNELNVQSFTTALEDERAKQAQGGYTGTVCTWGNPCTFDTCPPKCGGITVLNC